MSKWITWLVQCDLLGFISPGCLRNRRTDKELLLCFLSFLHLQAQHLEHTLNSLLQKEASMFSGGLQHTPRCLLDQGRAAPFHRTPLPFPWVCTHQPWRSPNSEERFPCYLLSVLQLQLGTRGVTRSNFSDNCIYALRRAGRYRHSQALAFYSKQKHPLHPLKSLF